MTHLRFLLLFILLIERLNLCLGHTKHGSHLEVCITPELFDQLIDLRMDTSDRLTLELSWGPLAGGGGTRLILPLVDTSLDLDERILSRQMLVQSLDILVVLEVVHGHMDALLVNTVTALEWILREKVVTFGCLTLSHGGPEEPILVQVREIF